MNNNQPTQTAVVINSPKDLEKISPGLMLSQPLVSSRFIELFNVIHGSEKGSAIFEREKFHFSKLLAENPKIAACSTLSLYGCLLDTAIDGLSLDPSLKLTYLIPQPVNVGTREQPKWESRCVRQIAPQGELILRQIAGQVKHADNVVIVYEGDTFEPSIDNRGNKNVIYKALIPNTSDKIIGGFIKLVRMDGSVDFFWMVERDINRLKGYSAKKNKTSGANELYSSQSGGIDQGFLAAKILKHAFKTYPKVKAPGKFTTLEPEDQPQLQPATPLKQIPSDAYGDIPIPPDDMTDDAPTYTDYVEETAQDAAPSQMSNEAKIAQATAQAEPTKTVNLKDGSGIF